MKEVKQKRWLHCKLELLFERLGEAVVQRPWRAMFLTSLVFGAIASGIMFLETETEYDKLYNPQRGESTREERFVRQRFGEAPRMQIAIVEAKADIFQEVALQEVLRLHSIVSSNRWEDVCKRAWLPDGPCQHSSILNLWEADSETLAADENLHATISSDPLWDPVLRQPADLEVWAANVIRNISRVVSANALQLTYTVDDSIGDPDGRTLKFELNDFIDTCLDFKSELIEASCAATSSYADLNERETQQNVIFVIASLMVMISYISFYLFRCNVVESRFTLGLTIVITVGLALCFALGICGYVGIPFTLLSFLSIFVLLGVGIDDMIIIVDALDRQAQGMQLVDEQCVVLALRDVGASILLSTMTDFVALFIGSFIDLPAVTYFCITAALAVFAVFLIQVTFFVACLALDVRRRRAKRCELCPCFKAVPRSNEREYSFKIGTERCLTANREISLGTERNGLTRPVEREYSCKIGTERRLFTKHSLQRREIASILARQLSAWSKIVVFVFIIMAAAFATTAVNFLKTGSDWSLFLPDGSYLLDFYDVRDKTFGEFEEVVFVSGRVRVEDQNHLAAVADLSSRVARVQDVSLPVYGWFEAWQNSANFSSTLTNLQAFVKTPEGQPYAEDVRFDGDRLVATRLRVLVAFPKNANRQVRLTRRLRRAARRAKAHNVKFRVSASRFAWLERYDAIYVNTVTTLGGAVVAVILLCSCLLTPLATALVAIDVLLVNISLLGGMAICEFRLNVVSLINLIMSIGFSVDFGAHIAFACSYHYTSNGGSAADAIEAALIELGPSILNGGASTALAVFILAFSSYFAYFQLAIMFLIMVISGLCHGLLFIPAAFCALHPSKL